MIDNPLSESDLPPPRFSDISEMQLDTKWGWRDQSYKSSYSISNLTPYLVQSPGHLNMLILNAQGINAKFDELMAFLETAHFQNIHFHIICIPETWLDKKYDLSLLQIEGCTLFWQGKRPECSNNGGLRWIEHNSFSTTPSISAQPRWLY